MLLSPIGDFDASKKSIKDAKKVLEILFFKDSPP
jgi:hypothetical protein